MSWIISRTFQDIFELIYRTFWPKKCRGNFKFQRNGTTVIIPKSNKPKFPENSLISRTFQDSKTFPDFLESGNPKNWKKVNCLYLYEPTHLLKVIKTIKWKYSQDYLCSKFTLLQDSKHLICTYQWQHRHTNIWRIPMPAKAIKPASK